ncbi:pseudo histidine-containing phosphotransfer protein 2 isoform X1 [Brachypodium distachyon]|uniref:pseudo histidine-containing phosphotransfer protein 2 isoform X1 n=1 Tax=Brachypodium distachyon TaxID=15368 RepID=UPI0005300067|nr:pseudo histidine-containing phosphotransfer protein 2 isoform X1 [Brachypodium distachyon]|eukprot:XP_010231632.1 pseudo histidine-containing phosphotransfer protein 2 isoform X1 [Brachypodium distachyon]
MPTLCSPRRLHAFELKCQFSEFGWTMWFVLKDCTDDLYLDTCICRGLLQLGMGIKATNILLDVQLMPYLSHCGLAKFSHFVGGTRMGKGRVRLFLGYLHHPYCLFSSWTSCKGYLDEQFNQLEELQDESSPNFVEEVVALFLKDSPRLLINIEQAIEKYPQDFYRLDSLVHQLKGSASSIGAVRMKNECSVLKAHGNDKNLEGCRRSLQKMKREHATLKQKLESYFQLLRQVGPRNSAVNSRK